ncbi:hypothetical protein ABE61_15360 [Lysinibacillus sphaericus]|nr:hypothetical protein [Lysinibacillus sphaericus]MBG9478491.1 hypothetical protein [Lysinibacillus sphaericus]MBG9594782.1 hypothetical protein [Lysinibacillus sphaericus]
MFQQLLHLLPSEKQEKLNRFTQYKDAQRGLVAELLIRNILREKGFSSDKICFQPNSFGKPFLPKITDVDFNLSHSEDWVVCALDRSRIGIDIEYIQAIDLDISNQFFTETECHYIFSNSEFQLDRFYDIWTMKESYLKAIGYGLSFPLNSFSVIQSDNDFMVDSIGEKYFLKLIEIDPAYKLSVCVSHSNLPLEVNIIKLDNLIMKTLR